MRTKRRAPAELWRYRGIVVTVAETADIPAQYRQGHERADVVQRALLSVEPWARGDFPGRGVTIELEDKLKQIVVPVDGLLPFWGKHAGHHARNVQVSPFVKMVRHQWTNRFTIELTSSPHSPRLVRAYPGNYHPPLPWQRSAEEAPGGVEACVQFWREHAYVFTDSIMASTADYGLRPPSWYTAQ